MADFVLSPSIVFRATYADGCPLVGGKVYTYLAGTVTPAATYQAEDGAANTNPVLLNARGEANIWLDPTIAYKIEVRDADDNVVIPPKDNIRVGSIGFDAAIVATIGDLRDYTGTATLIYAFGYEDSGDGCGGWFQFNSADTRPDDGVIVFAPNSVPASGRWVRDFDGGPLSLRLAGDNGARAESSTYTQLILAYIQAYGGTIYYPPGTYIFSNFTIPKILMLVDEGTEIKVTDGDTLVINAKISGPGALLFVSETDYTGSVNLSASSDTVCTPEMFGALGDGTTNDRAAIIRMYATNCALYSLPSTSGYLCATSPGLPTATSYKIDAVKGIFTAGPVYIVTSGITINQRLSAKEIALSGSPNVIGDLVVSGGINAAGTIQATDSTSDVVAGRDVVAGFAGQGALQARAGTSAQIGKASVRIGNWFGSVGNVGTGEDVLAEFYIPANTLVDNNSTIYVRAHGFIVLSDVNKRIRLRYGGVAGPILFDSDNFSSDGADSANDRWNLDIFFTKTGTNTVLIGGQLSLDTSLSIGFAAPSKVTRFNIVNTGSTRNGVQTVALGTDSLLTLTGEATSNNDILAKSLVADYQPAVTNYTPS